MVYTNCLSSLQLLLNIESTFSFEKTRWQKKRHAASVSYPTTKPHLGMLISHRQNGNNVPMVGSRSHRLTVESLFSIRMSI